MIILNKIVKPPFEIKIYQIIIIIFFIQSCVGSESNSRTLKSQTQNVKIFQSNKYDKNGFPVFENELNNKNHTIDRKYIIVYYENSKPIKSFNIVVLSGEEVEFEKPLKIFIRNTGNGFKAGLDISSSMGFNNSRSRPESAPFQIAIVALPIIVGTFSGAVIGIIKSIPEIGIQILNIFDKDKERIYSYTLYNYDELDRLVSYSIFLPTVENRPVSITHFSYKGKSMIPAKITYQKM